MSLKRKPANLMMRIYDKITDIIFVGRYSLLVL